MMVMRRRTRRTMASGGYFGFPFRCCWRQFDHRSSLLPRLSMCGPLAMLRRTVSRLWPMLRLPVRLQYESLWMALASLGDCRLHRQLRWGPENHGIESRPWSDSTIPT
jgi:hypothetical protein